jgi:RNA polymerase sigma-70 factor, ECF subfamily
MSEELSDIELIERYLSSDCEAFDLLYNRYRKQLYAYLNRLLPGQHAVADDIFQQTWIKVIRRLPDYKDSQKFLAWTMRISHNLTIDYFRKSKREILCEDNDNDLLFSSDNLQPWMNLDREELAEALNVCIAKLNTEQREVFILRQDGIGFKEIAEIQDSSINTALGRMQYALRNLRKCMQSWKR